MAHGGLTCWGGGQHTSWGDPWRVVPPRQLENLSAQFRKPQESPALSHSRHGPHFPASEGSYKKKKTSTSFALGLSFPARDPSSPRGCCHPPDAAGEVLGALGSPKRPRVPASAFLLAPRKAGRNTQGKALPLQNPCQGAGIWRGGAQGFATHPPQPPACSQIWPLSQEHRVHPTRDGAPHAPPKSFLNSSSASLKQGRAAPHIFLGQV